MERPYEVIDSVVIGAGQAGLCTSYFLSKNNIEHVVLERGRIAESWRSERWDSLRFQFESSIANLPGFPFSGPAADSFMHRDEAVQILDAYAAFASAPVRSGVLVDKLSLGEDGLFEVRTADQIIKARNVVAATGPYQRAIIPDISSQAPRDVAQLPANRYCNASQLPAGAVLVVGAGSSGYQIAEDLLENGRKVILAAGRHRALPRRYRGHDLGHWLQVTGLLEQKVQDMAPDLPTVLLSGHNNGEKVDIRWLADRGVQIVGKLNSINNDSLCFSQDLPDILEECDAHIAGFKAMIDEHSRASGSGKEEASADTPPPLPPTPQSLSFSRDDVSAIIWAIGYRYDFSWVDLDVCDTSGIPQHKGGVTSVPGFYFMGLQYQSKLKSAFFWGSGEDAEFIAGQIADRQSLSGAKNYAEHNANR